MKKIFSLVLAMLFVVSMAASAATAGTGGVVTSALGETLMTAGGGFDVTLSKVSDTIIKAKIQLTGTLNYVTAAYCTISYDSNNIVLVNATELLANAATVTEYTAANSTIKDGFAEDLGSGEKSTDWPAKSAAIGFSTSPTRGYAKLGFERNSATISPRTFAGKDWYNIYFKVKNGVSINATNFGTYFWVPNTAGPDITKITMVAPGSSSSESVSITTPTGTDTAAVIKSVNFERISFYTAPVVTHTVTFKAEGSADITKTVNDGATLTDIPAVPAKTGFTGAWDTTDFTNIKADKTVTAVYTPITFTVTFKAAGSADIVKTVNYGATLTDIPAVPAKAGYTGAWDTTDFTNITANKTVTAVYTEVDNNTYITASISGNGRVEVNGTRVANNDKINLGAATTATIKVYPAMGYEVETATLGGASISSDKDGFVYSATGLSGNVALNVTFTNVRSVATKPQICKETFKETGLTSKDGKKTGLTGVTSFASKPTSGTITGFGVKLTTLGGADVTIPDGTGPMFPFTATETGSGQYGVQFIGLAAGTYISTPYAIVDGVTVYGSPVTFIVE